jgi:phytol kinase
MCGGDGLADITGRRYGKIKLPWNQEILGCSLSMLLGGWVFAAVILAVFLAAGVFQGSLTHYLPALTLIALVGTVVESRHSTISIILQ